MNTLILEKANVARLRDLYEKETDPLIKESIQFRLAEARLWHDVAEYKLLSPERIEQVRQVRQKKCRTGAIVCFVIAGIAAVILIFGCSVARESLHLVGAVGEDVGWIANKAAENIQTEK